MTAAEEMRYVLLNPGDVIQKGDEFWSVCRDWEPVDHSIGMSAILPWLPIRRATTLPAEPAPMTIADAARMLALDDRTVYFLSICQTEDEVQTTLRAIAGKTPNSATKGEK